MAGPRGPAGLTASAAVVVDHVLSRREGTRRRAPSIRGRRQRPRRVRIDDPGRAGRVHPERRLRLPLHRSAEITGRSPAACRQLASTARRRVRASQAAAGLASPAGQPRQGLQKAWEARDTGALIGILDPEATVTADGGGLVTAALRPPKAASRSPASTPRSPALRPTGQSWSVWSTALPGLVAQLDGVVTVFAFGIAGDRIKHIWAVRTLRSSGPGR